MILCVSVHRLLRKKEAMKISTDQRGAAFTEFVIATIPLFATFFGFVQLAQNAMADLYVRHAANAGARAAAVMASSDNPGTHSGRDGIAKAARESLGRLGGGNTPLIRLNASDVSVSEGSGPTGTMRVEVKATLNCRVPFGNMLACGGRTREITHSATFPKQGARYK